MKRMKNCLSERIENMTFHTIRPYLVFAFLLISVSSFPEETNPLKQSGEENPYGWSLERIPWNVQDQALREQKWVKSEESFLYPQGEDRFLDATVYSLKQPKERIDVVWQEYEGKRIPYLIRIAGESSKWHLGEKIAIGKNWVEIEKALSKTLQIDRTPVLMDGPEGYSGYLCDSSYLMSFSRDSGFLPKILPEGIEQSDSIQQIKSIELIFDYEAPRNIDINERTPKKDFFILREVKIRYSQHGNLPVRKPPLKSPYLLNPGKSAGAIDRNTTRNNLEKTFGKENLTPGIINDTEDIYSTATLVFAKDPLRRIAVAWDPDALNKKVDFVSIEYTYGSLWHLDSGLTIGTPLKTLERINGGPFPMTCMDLDNLWGRATGKFASVMWVQFSYLWCAGRQIDWEKHPEIHSSRSIESSNRQLQEMNPRIGRIDVNMEDKQL
ncbi:MAG TPA: hypothetical protein PLA90_06015 [Candidatus Sumerlaeota bacterium]|nr:hypothetical protein [Candidatus Sumerlaeota bacterium]HPS01081.1 hypothetical protein [Candidatus Sumerlaeota bacterium]